MSRFHVKLAAGMSTLAAVLVTTSTAAAAPAAPQLDVYAGDIPRDALGKLVELGVDRHEIDLSAARSGGKSAVHVETILTGQQAEDLADEGITLTPKEIDGKTVTQRATAEAAAGLEVFRKYGRPGRPEGGVRAHGQPPPATDQAGQDRQDDQRPGHRRDQDQHRRAPAPRRLEAVRGLHRRTARARMDHAGDEPAADALLPRQLLA